MHRNAANWKTVRIGDTGKLVTGKTPPTKHKEFFNGNIPFITPTDINENSYSVKTARYLTELASITYRNYLLPKGSVCVVCIGATIGKICMTTEPSFTNQQINSVIVDQDNFDNRFLYYLLKVHKNGFKGIAGGAATPIVNKTAFSNVEVKVPYLLIQKKIGTVLSAYDELIENNTRRIQILEKMALRVYKEWFVHFRLPGHENLRMVDSELGMIPEGWNANKLGNLCAIVMGQSPKSEYYNEEGKGLPFHQGVKDFGSRFPKHRVYCTVEKRIAEEGDILFSVRAPVGRINIANTKLVIGRGLSAIRSNNGNQEFIHYQLAEKFKTEDIMGGGTIFKAVTKADMHGIEMLEPPKSIVDEFEHAVIPISNQLLVLTEKNDVLRQTRDLLLPKLISGKIDVTDVNIDIGATEA